MDFDKEIALLSLGISIAGWIAAYFFSIKANRDLLKRSIMNEARREISDALHDYCDWILALTMPLRIIATHEREDMASMFDDVVRQAGSVMRNDPRAIKWLRLFEGYEALYPEALVVRTKVLNLHRNVTRRISDDLIAFNDLREPTDTIFENLDDLAALAIDLQVYIQNKMFKDLTGYEVRYRVPTDENVPVILPDSSGMLTITNLRESRS